MGQRGPVWCAWDEGYMAHVRGKPVDANPFHLNCDEERDDWEQWDMGWHDALVQQADARLEEFMNSPEFEAKRGEK